MQQRVNKPRPLKRMDECAREQEQRDHQEMLSRARRASNKAKRTSAMAEALGVTADVAPQTLYATTSSNPEWLALQPSSPPPAFSNNHLGYAITWFGLAIALIGFYVALLRRHYAKVRP